MVDDGTAGLIAFTTALTCAVVLVPLAAVFRVPRGWRRGVMAAYVVGMGGVWAAMVWNFADAARATNPWEVRAALREAKELFEANLIAGFLANGLITVRR
ncbi:MAG: hypothetical protein JWO38_5725 [Gemmataceae bacterium]|nr:hypothetical protein [Gemmataceae bacterium]